jgi:hypothetical protein
VIFTQMQNVRSKSQQARAELAESATYRAEMLAEALGGCRAVSRSFAQTAGLRLDRWVWKYCATWFLTRASIAGTCACSGIGLDPLPDELAYRIWNWKKLCKGCGSPDGPGCDS